MFGPVTHEASPNARQPRHSGTLTIHVAADQATPYCT